MIVVLGGTGIVGSRLVFHCLKRNQALRLLYRTETKKQKLIHYLLSQGISENQIELIHWIHGNLLNDNVLNQLINEKDEVYHCANFVSFDERDRKELLETNHIGTQRVVDICIEKRVSHLVYVSSIATKDTEKDQIVIDENSPWLLSQEHSSYAESKYLAELEVWRGQAEGLNTLIVSPGVILSDYNFKQSSGTLFQENARKLGFYTEGTVALIDADDVAKCILYLIGINQLGNSFILVAESLSFKEVSQIIRQELNLSKPKKLSRFWLTIFRLLYPLISTFLPFMPKFSISIWSALTSRHQYNTEKIKKVYPNSFTDIRTQLRIYTKSFQHNERV